MNCCRSNFGAFSTVQLHSGPVALAFSDVPEIRGNALNALPLHFCEPRFPIWTPHIVLS